MIAQVLVGSYISVAGAFLGLQRPVRASLFGILMIIWGLGKEIMTRKQEQEYKDNISFCYPTLAIALVSAFLSIRGDVRRILRTRRTYSKPKYA